MQDDKNNLLISALFLHESYSKHVEASPVM